MKVGRVEEQLLVGGESIVCSIGKVAFGGTIGEGSGEQ